MIMRATAVPALAALAVIHVLDLPGTLAPEPLVGIGYFAIIAAAIMAGGAMIARSHWLAWAAAGGLGVAAMAGYVLTRALPGVSSTTTAMWATGAARWASRALSVEALIILLAAGWAWHARARTTSWAAKARSAGSRAPEYSRPG